MRAVLRGAVILAGLSTAVAAIWVFGRETPPETGGSPGGAHATAAGADAAPSRPRSSKSDEPMLLSEEKRKLVWEEEDRTFQLGKKILGPWDSALKANADDLYVAALAPGFRGRVGAAAPPAQMQRLGVVEYAYAEAKPDEGEVSDGKAFLATLKALRAEIPSASTTHWAITRLAPVDGKATGPTSWTGRFQLEIRGEAAPGVRAETVVSWRVRTGVLPRDLSKLSGWLEQADVVSIRRVRAAGAPLMRDVTATSGIPVETFHDNWKGGPWIAWMGGVFVEDYDRDGILDLLFVDSMQQRLFRGLEGGRFVDRTVEAGLPTEVASRPRRALFADLDGDGWPDLILSDAVGTKSGSNRVLRNTGHGTFEDVTKVANLPIPRGTYNLSVADYDGDGRVDIYCSTVLGDRDETRRGGGASWLDDHTRDPNRLFRNLGGFQFEDVTDATGTGDRGRSFTSVWLDHDGDRFPDLFVVNEIGQNALYLNSGKGAFTKIDPDGTRFGGFSMGVDAGDVDGDGRTDVYVSNMYSKAGTRIIGLLDEASYPPGIYAKVKDFVTGNRLYLHAEDGSLRDVGAEKRCANAGWAYGVRMVDLDGDGWLDLYSTAGHKSVSPSEPDG